MIPNLSLHIDKCIKHLKDDTIEVSKCNNPSRVFSIQKSLFRNQLIAETIYIIIIEQHNKINNHHILVNRTA